MMPRRSFIAISAAGSILSASAFASAQTLTGSAFKTGYAAVNGLKMYYEIHGAGEPLILLHGGVVGITMFGPNLDALSQKRKVIAVELQGYGRTADSRRCTGSIPMSIGPYYSRSSVICCGRIMTGRKRSRRPRPPR